MQQHAGSTGCKNLHETKSLGSLFMGDFFNSCGCRELKRTSASSETECTESHCNTPPPPLSPPATSRPVPCDGATARAPAAPATPSTWTRSAARPAARPRSCPGLQREAKRSLKSFRWLQRGLWVGKNQALTAVDGQVDVAVLCSQDVGGRAAVQAGGLWGHVDNLDGAWQIPWERRETPVMSSGLSGLQTSTI